MILAAALLVLVALGLFVGGILTGLTAMYWACVAVSAVAAILLVLARRQLSRPPTAGTRPAEREQRAPAEPIQRTPEPIDRAAEPEEPAAAAARHASAPEETAPAGSTAVGASYRYAGERASNGGAGAGRGGADDDPPIEEVEVTDLLLVVDLHDEVVVVDEHPRYHLPECRFLTGRTGIPLPMDEARADGFTPCALCTPDRQLAERERARRAGRQAP